MKANKIWNASRFVMMNLTIDHVELPEQLELEDKWVLSKLNTLVKEVTDNMDAFEIGVASAKVYDFIWDTYCDWFIELCKARLTGDDECAKINAQNVLCYVLIETLKLLHPFMPFITEEIYQALPHTAEDKGEFIMLQKWPEYRDELSFPREEEAMGLIIDAITAIRAHRNEMNVALEEGALHHRHRARGHLCARHFVLQAPCLRERCDRCRREYPHAGRFDRGRDPCRACADAAR